MYTLKTDQVRVRYAQWWEFTKKKKFSWEIESKSVLDACDLSFSFVSASK